jgi:uncharacterized protein YihD (DUF1040 family)
MSLVNFLTNLATASGYEALMSDATDSDALDTDATEMAPGFG